MNFGSPNRQTGRTTRMLQVAVDALVFDPRDGGVVSVVVGANRNEADRMFRMVRDKYPGCISHTSPKKILFHNGELIFRSAQDKLASRGDPIGSHLFVDHYAYECGAI